MKTKLSAMFTGKRLFSLCLVHLMQNGHVGGKKSEKADFIIPSVDEPKSPRLSMKDTFEVEEADQNGRMSLRDRLAQRQKQKSNERSSSSESPMSSTTNVPALTKTLSVSEDTNDNNNTPARKQSTGEVAGAENRRMMLRKMYGSSVDKTDQEMSEEMKKTGCQ